MQGTMTPTKSPELKAVAGLKPEEHYLRRLSPWRYRLREAILPIVRLETPYLHKLQQTLRSPALDSYFAITANLGTHTFYLTCLPLLYWCGYVTAARALIHMLGAGVFFSGWLKDLVCIPRPLSPPLKRIDMSGSAALEYGLPSTHATNAASVAVYLLYGIYTGDLPVSDTYRPAAMAACYAYAISISAGRLYCGMHGFTDVLVGALIGIVIAAAQIVFGPLTDDTIAHGGFGIPLVLTIVIILAVRFHPEPADNCPCFDDSVSFAGVIIGIEAGHAHFSKTSFAWDVPAPGTAPFSLAEIGFVKTCLRLVSGVAIILAWRAAMKPVFLRALPPLFRQIEYLGLDLPRRFFTRASQYKKVPPLRRDDNVIPPAKDIGAFFSRLGEGRSRTISVGPQSEADARELMAQREIQRKHSWKSLRLAALNGDIAMASSNAVSPTEGPALPPLEREDDATSDQTDREQDQAMFRGLERPRARYDVEVVTRLIIYTGIGMLSADLLPIFFELAGLGVP